MASGCNWIDLQPIRAICDISNSPPGSHRITLVLILEKRLWLGRSWVNKHEHAVSPGSKLSLVWKQTISEDYHALNTAGLSELHLQLRLQFLSPWRNCNGTQPFIFFWVRAAKDLSSRIRIHAYDLYTSLQSLQELSGFSGKWHFFLRTKLCVFLNTINI